MKLDKPEWLLAKKYGWCPHHDDQNRFRFICCGTCGEILLECEEGHIYKAELPLSEEYQNQACAFCKVSTENAANATSEQIRSIGFEEADYE